MALPAYRVAKGLADGREKVAYTAGSTVTAGSLVELRSDGFVDIAAANAAKILGVAATGGVVTEEIVVATAMPGVIFSAANAAGANWTAALVGDVQAAAVAGVDVGTATGGGATMVGIDHTDDPGDGSVRVLFYVDSDKSQAPGGSATPT
jgi:hypothetical protein